jgi:hypothetical protein
LGTLKDRLSEHAEGYSFIQDPANHISTPDEEYCTRICLDPKDGLMSKDGWNTKAVDAFLKAENALLTSLMLTVFLRSGQAVRSTELLSIECSNSRSSSRSVYIYQGRMMLVTRHSKARKSTNKEFQVARFLTKEDSQLLALYLIYVRPLAALLQRECYGLFAGRRLLRYSTLERVAFQSVPRLIGSCDLGSRRVPGFAQTAVCGIVGCRERDAFLDTSPFSA